MNSTRKCFKFDSHSKINVKQLSEELNFTAISVKHSAADFKYIVGTLPLEKLIKHKDYILKNKLFIALTEDAIITSLTNKATILAEEILEKEYANNY